jgi:hypothetical protein
MNVNSDNQVTRPPITVADEKASGSGRYVYIFMSAFLAGLTAPLARRIKHEFGWPTILVTSHHRDLPRPERFGWEAHDFDEILDLHDVLKARSPAMLPDPKALSDACAQLERDYGISALDIVKGDRHLA